MWSTNVCKTLNQPTFGYVSIAKILRPFSFQTIGGVKQLVASSFYKARAIFKYFGKNSIEIRPKFNNYSVAIRNVADSSSTSILGRVVVGKQFPNRRFNAYFENAKFKVINRRQLTGTGLTFGLVGVFMKNENGYPDLLPAQENNFSLTDVFQSMKINSFELKELREDVDRVDLVKFKNCISKGCSGVVYKAEINSKDASKTDPVAVKMLFNYDIESNSMAIISSTVKECLPYNGKFGNVEVKRKKLPPHPNIVKILSVFVDYFQPLENCKKLYPHALPLQYGGYGRNMTLFIVEKLYDMTLRQYLNLFSPSPRCSMAILTQCFEAIDFLQINGISHRDLKTDNILVSVTDGAFPWIVVADFGICTSSLVLPFQTDEVCRGGNRALMAPEIVTAKPSQESVLDYTKSDLWSMGTIAYEIFGVDNPFYKRTPLSTKLDSAFYHESHLPPFPSSSPILSKMIKRILQRDPNKRPTTEFVSGLSHLIFNMGSKNVNCLTQISNVEMRNKLVDDWFKLFSGQTLYQAMNGMNYKSSEYKMKLLLLTKMQSNKIKMLFQNVNEYLM